MLSLALEMHSRVENKGRGSASQRWSWENVVLLCVVWETRVPGRSQITLISCHQPLLVAPFHFSVVAAVAGKDLVAMRSQLEKRTQCAPGERKRSRD